MSDKLPVRQQVVATLRSEILALRFTPGEKLIERRLCELTGASRTALREGLRQLEAEGLIDIIANRGPIVPKLTQKHAKDIYQLRGVLEADLAHQAAQVANGHDLMRLREISQRVEASMLGGKRLPLILAKSEFYDWLMDLTGNEETNAVLRRLLGRTAIIWPSTVLMDQPVNDSSYQLFSDLVEALAAHDGTWAAQAARVNVEAACAFVLAYLEAT